MVDRGHVCSSVYVSEVLDLGNHCVWCLVKVLMRIDRRAEDDENFCFVVVVNLKQCCMRETLCGYSVG